MLLTQLPDNAPGDAAEDGPCSRAPATQVENASEVPGSWLQLDPALATAVICGVN